MIERCLRWSESGRFVALLQHPQPPTWLCPLEAAQFSSRRLWVETLLRRLNPANAAAALGRASALLAGRQADRAVVALDKLCQQGRQERVGVLLHGQAMLAKNEEVLSAPQFNDGVRSLPFEPRRLQEK